MGLGSGFGFGFGSGFGFGLDVQLEHVPLPLRLEEELLVGVDQIDAARLGHLVRVGTRGRARARARARGGGGGRGRGRVLWRRGHELQSHEEVLWRHHIVCIEAAHLT